MILINRETHFFARRKRIIRVQDLFNILSIREDVRVIQFEFMSVTLREEYVLESTVRGFHVYN